MRFIPCAHGALLADGCVCVFIIRRIWAMTLWGVLEKGYNTGYCASAMFYAVLVAVSTVGRMVPCRRGLQVYCLKNLFQFFVGEPFLPPVFSGLFTTLATDVRLSSFIGCLAEHTYTVAVVS